MILFSHQNAVKNTFNSNTNYLLSSKHSRLLGSAIADTMNEQCISLTLINVKVGVICFTSTHFAMLDDVLKQLASANVFHHHEDVCRSADDLIAAAAVTIIVTDLITSGYCNARRRLDALQIAPSPGGSGPHLIHVPLGPHKFTP